MSFDVGTWKKNVQEHLQEWRARLGRTGIKSLYASLSAATLWPVVQAAQGGQLLPASVALGSVAGGIGGNLLAEQVQRWKDQSGEEGEDELAAWIAENMATNDALREALDAILERMDTVLVAQKVLSEEDRQWLVQTLKEELAGLGNVTRFEASLSGAGAIVQGEGAKGAGKRGIVADTVQDSQLSTGDHSRNVRAGTYVEQMHLSPDPQQKQAAQAYRRYLTRLQQQCNMLPLAAMGGDEAAGEEVTLDQVYIGLDTRTMVSADEESESRTQRQPRRHQIREGGDDRPLTALEAATRDRRLVLLGDPGSGKSTFVRQLTARVASAALGERKPLPEWENNLFLLIIFLRDLAPALADLTLDNLSDEKRDQVLVDAVRRQWVAQLHDMQASAFEEGLEKTLDDGNVLLVFDGLDEVSEAGRWRVRQAVLGIRRAYPKVTHVIITCRIRSYTGGTLLPGFPVHTLAPFDDEKIRQFVTAWYRAQADLGRLDRVKVEARSQDLEQAALSTDLRDLASNPMLLTTMAIIHQREVGLPRERVRLYDQAVQVLLTRWQKHKGEAVSGRLAGFLRNDLKLRGTLERLAYMAQQQQAQQGKDTALARPDLLAQLEQSDVLGDAGLASEFLAYIDHRAGLLIGHGGDDRGGHPQTYSFPHRTFQEYLAGCQMVAGRSIHREYRRRADEGDYWALAVQLGAEELFYNRRSPQTLLDLAYDLCPASEPSQESEWRTILWSGQMADLLGRDCIEGDTEGSDGGRTYLKRLKTRLVDLLRKSPLPALERCEAGRVLARVGDPRPEVLMPEQMVLCHIPAGAFLMGSRDDDSRADDDERPQHSCTIPYDYMISQFPVTNAHSRLLSKTVRT